VNQPFDRSAIILSVPAWQIKTLRRCFCLDYILSNPAKSDLYHSRPQHHPPEIAIFIIFALAETRQ